MANSLLQKLANRQGVARPWAGLAESWRLKRSMTVGLAYEAPGLIPKLCHLASDELRVGI